MIQIENYISSFLLKNKYCAISGLGTLELRREASVYNKEDSRLEPPEYNISFKPIGVIDDAFATFIANHENVSISKASNDIKTFSQDVKEVLRKTGRFEIDGVGHFTYKNETIQFHQDDTLNLEQDPIQLYQEKTQETSESEETLADANTFKDLNYTHAESGVGKPRMGTILKYLLGLLLLIGLAAAAYFGYKFYSENYVQGERAGDEEAIVMDVYEDSDDAEATTEEEVSESDTVDLDTNDMVEVGSANNAPVTASGEYKVAVQAYSDAAEAKAKSDRLNSWDNKTTVITKGDKHYIVVYSTLSSGDTTQLKDSLRRHFNPGGTPFMVK